MDIVFGLLLIGAGLVIYAWMSARPSRLVLAGACALAPTLIGEVLLARAGVVDGMWWWVLFAAWAFALFTVHQAATILRNTRKMAHGLTSGIVSVSEPRAELSDLSQLATEGLGFVPTPEGAVQVGANHLAVLVHPEGTRIEIIQGDEIPAGYACVTEMESGRPVVSMPWAHGVDRDRVRVPGATLTELLEHHRAEVARRVDGGDSVRLIAAADALAAVMASDQDEVRVALAEPWRNSLRLALQQGPLRSLLGP